MPTVSASLPRSFNSSVRIEVRETLPLEPDDKPDGAVPRHVYLGIEGVYADRVRNSVFDPGIAVYDVEEFRDVLTTQPETLDGFNERLEVLRSLLKEKRPLDSQDEIGIVRYMEPKQVLRAHTKYVSFKGGHALLYLTQFNNDPGYITNRHLTYIVQGLTNDGRYYLFGTFPVTVGFLPKDSDFTEFEGYKIPMYTLTEAEAQEYSRYLSRIETRLGNTPSGKFQPDLREIDKFISGIEVSNE